MSSKKGRKQDQRRAAARPAVRGECRPGRHGWRPGSDSDSATGSVYFYVDCWRCGSRVICWSNAPTVTAEGTSFAFAVGSVGPGGSAPSEGLRAEAERLVRNFLNSASEREGASYTVLGVSDR